METLGLFIPILFAKSTEFFNICILVSNLGNTFKAPSVIIRGLSSFVVVGQENVVNYIKVQLNLNLS